MGLGFRVLGLGFRVETTGTLKGAIEGRKVRMLQHIFRFRPLRIMTASRPDPMTYSQTALQHPKMPKLEQLVMLYFG